MEASDYAQNVNRCKLTGTRLISIDQLKPSRYQTRHGAFDEAGDLGNLAESIRSVGLLELPSVRRISDGKQVFYEIMTGHRRIQTVSKYLGWKQVKCNVYEDVNEFEAFCIALTENIQRANLSPYEEGMSYLACQKIFGLSDSQIAERLHRSTATVVSRKQFAASANNCLKHLDESDARRFLQNYTHTHHELLAQVEDISQIAEIIRLIRDGATIKQIKSLFKIPERPRLIRIEGETRLRIRGRSNRIEQLNQLREEIERLKEEAPDEIRSRIYLLEDLVDDIHSYHKEAQQQRDIKSKLKPTQVEETPREFPCPNCGKTLEVQRRLNERDNSVLFVVHTPDERTERIRVVQFPRIL
jgi:ParB/RepB/Spo0J family partition protein